MIVPLGRSPASISIAPLPAVGDDPAAWLELARCTPPLARTLIAATTRLGSAESADVTECRLLSALEDWTQRFLRRPPWEVLDETTDLEPAEPRSVSRATLRFAHEARTIAWHSGWLPPDVAFWGMVWLAPRLGQAGRPPAAWRFPTLRRLLQAVRFLRGLQHDLPVDLAGAGGDTEPGHLVGPEIHWDVLAADLRGAAVPEARDWDDARRARIAESIQRNALRSQLRGWQLACAVAEAKGFARLLNTSLDLVEDRLGPACLWLAMPDGLGIGAATGSASDEPAWRGTRDAFEREFLPIDFRASAPLDAEGLTWLYTPADQRPSLPGPWFERIAKAHRRLWDLHQRLGEQSRRQRLLGQALSERGPRRRARWRAMIAHFAAGAGHMIHNPLAAIAVHAQRLLQHETDPKRRDALAAIQSQVARVHGMIRDLHLLGRPAPPRESWTVHLLDDVVRAAITAAAKGLEVGSIEYGSPPADLTVRGDRERLERMLSEVLRNAIQAAGKSGEVRAYVDTEAEEALVCVVDSGAGFGPEARQHAGDPFYSGADAGRGLGMGLPIALRIAEDHGGSIRLQHQPPTTVVVTLPCQRAPA